MQRDDEEERKRAAAAASASESKPAPTAKPEEGDAKPGAPDTKAPDASAGQGSGSDPKSGTAGPQPEGGATTPVPSSPTEATPTNPAPPPKPPGPSFARDPGLEEAPAPVEPTARTFTPDPAAKLPAKEPEPDLSLLNADKPWWSDSAAKAFGEKLADSYAKRGLKTGKAVDRDEKLRDLERDLDDVIKGWLFGRTRFAIYWQPKQPSRWDQLPGRMSALLQQKRTEVVNGLKAADAKLPKDKRASKDELDATLEQRMQRERFDLVESLRRNVALATWAWMAERREKLDFDTIKQQPTGAEANLAELLTTDEMRDVIRAVLATNKKAFTDTDRESAVKRAQAVRDAAAKKAKREPVAMTDDEKATAIAAAEYDRLKQSGLEGQLKAALMTARTTKDEANLVVPTKADVKGWDTSNQIRIHKDVVALLKVLEGEFTAGFRAQTYKINVEGDHGSAGFQGRFRSLDMYPNDKNPRPKTPFGDIGFFGQQLAYDFALAIDRAVQGRGTYQILYNDFPVARELNKVLKNGRVMNIDNVTADGGGASNLNWHGPLVTHFHVDFAI